LSGNVRFSSVKEHTNKRRWEWRDPENQRVKNEKEREKERMCTKYGVVERGKKKRRRY
jgi:hypothetical protein